MNPILIFESGTVISCLDPEAVTQLHAKATLMITSPVDLLVAARAATVDGTIYGLVSKLLSPQVARDLSPNNKLYNNPHEWFTALRRVSRSLAVSKKERSYMSTIHEAPLVSDLVKKERASFSRKSLSGKVIHLLQDKNPKRPNTPGHTVFELYFQHAPLTVDRFFDLGGRTVDLRCDLEKGFVCLKDA